MESFLKLRHVLSQRARSLCVIDSQVTAGRMPSRSSLRSYRVASSPRNKVSSGATDRRSKQVCNVEKILEKRARENAGALINIAKNCDISGILVDLTVCVPFPCISHLV